MRKILWPDRNKGKRRRQALKTGTFRFDPRFLDALKQYSDDVDASQGSILQESALQNVAVLRRMYDRLTAAASSTSKVSERKAGPVRTS